MSLASQQGWNRCRPDQSVEPITTSNQLLLLEAIDRVREDVDAPRLPLDELTETTFALVAEHMSLEQIIDAAVGLIQLASHPTRPKTALPLPVAELQALVEKVLVLQAWQELEEEDDRDDSQKLIDNATDSDAVLVRDPVRTPEPEEIGTSRCGSANPSGDRCTLEPRPCDRTPGNEARLAGRGREGWESYTNVVDGGDTTRPGAAGRAGYPTRPCRTELSMS